MHSESSSTRAGSLRPLASSASHAASVQFARKPDGTWRFCQDFRRLNAITQRSVEPLPDVDHVHHESRGSRFFTKLDLAMANMQFRIREEDHYKTSFRDPRALADGARDATRSMPKCRFVGQLLASSVTTSSSVVLLSTPQGRLSRGVGCGPLQPSRSIRLVPCRAEL